MKAQFPHSLPTQFFGQSALPSPLICEELKRAEPKAARNGSETCKDNETK